MTVQIKKNIVKKYFLSRDSSLFYNELYWLKKFEKYDFIPKIIDADYKNYIISLSYVGEKISNNNKPINWQNQLNEGIKKRRLNDWLNARSRKSLPLPSIFKEVEKPID